MPRQTFEVGERVRIDFKRGMGIEATVVVPEERLTTGYHVRVAYNMGEGVRHKRVLNSRSYIRSLAEWEPLRQQKEEDKRGRAAFQEWEMWTRVAFWHKVMGDVLHRVFTRVDDNDIERAVAEAQKYLEFRYTPWQDFYREAYAKREAERAAADVGLPPTF